MYTAQSATREFTVSVPAQAPVLTRERLAGGCAKDLLRQDEPDGKLLLSDEKREASLAEFLGARPSGDLWFFAYGSLVWNPAMRVAERRVACIQDWHRAFCLSTFAGRGTPHQPGLVLGLERGGACRGVAYRIAEQDIASELPVLWSREMLLGGYNPVWVDVLDEDEKKFGVAISFVIDPDHEHYAGNLPHDEKIHRLSTARGSWGSSADYLFRTIRALQERGICDEEIERLGEMVGAVTGEDLRDAA